MGPSEFAETFDKLLKIFIEHAEKNPEIFTNELSYNDWERKFLNFLSLHYDDYKWNSSICEWEKVV